MKRKKDAARRIALSAIGAAISLAAVTAAFYVQNMTLSFNIIAALGIMLPLTKKYFREAILAYIAVSAIGAIYTTIYILPFVLVTGGFTIAEIFMYEKKIKLYISYPIKIIWSCIVFLILYYAVKILALDLTKLGLEDLHPALIYFLFNLVFTICFIVYDAVMLWTYKFICQKLPRGNNS